MKKLLLFITVLFFGISTINAQDDANYGFAKGDWVMGGSVTFGSADTDGVETSDSTIAPGAHYFMSDNWALGVSVGLMSSDDGSNEISDTNVSFSARNYFMDLNERNKIYFSLGLGIDSGDSYSDSATSFGAGFGINYFMTENIIIDFNLANILSYNKQGDNSSMNIGWEGTMNNRWASPTLGIIFKL